MAVIPFQEQTTFINVMSKAGQTLIRRRIDKELERHNLGAFYTSKGTMFHTTRLSATSDIENSRNLSEADAQIIYDLQHKQLGVVSDVAQIWQAMVPMMMKAETNWQQGLHELARSELDIECDLPFNDLLEQMSPTIQKQWAERYLPKLEYYVGLGSIL